MRSSTIDILLASRSKLLEKDYNDPKVDDMTKEIIQAIKIDFDNLDSDYIIESYTKLGASPSILYDDNGFFSIQSNGTQDLPVDDKGNEKLVQNISFFIDDKESWKPTIKEAIKYWIEHE